MIDTIKAKLKEIEERENIKILHCVESGSRAWGFASPDSDYDVRFIYVRQKEFYLRLDKTRDVIEWQLDDVYDINGWDLKKALQLLHSSNPTLFEWNLSPIVYKTTQEWQEISKYFNNYFLQKNGLYHYLSTAKSNYREYIKGENVKQKKYLYVLRPILACKWIIDRKTPPPMLFSELVKNYLEDNMQEEVRKLLDIKMHSPETLMVKRIDKINEYIDKNLTSLEDIIANYPSEEKNDWVQLNAIFQKIVLNSL